MRLIPAIDLHGGECVRLYQGDFNQSTQYSDDPLAIARQFSQLDVSDLHIVDLDGARTGSQKNAAAVRAIADIAPFDIQLGGGIRDASVANRWFDNGVKRCIVGSMAVLHPTATKRCLKRFGAHRIVLALDVVFSGDGVPMLATHGWTKTSGTELWECLETYQVAGLRHVLCTDISRDGALSGPNIELYTEIMRRYPEIRLQASGGIRSSTDLSELRRRGIPAAITGRALLDGRISAAEVASFQQSA